MTALGNDLTCSPHRRAFTLIEVTISVAIAVVLMLGIAQVFRIVGDTVGTGQVLASAQRDSRAAQAVMAGDFNAAVSDGAPFMLLFSQQQWAFRNPADLLSDKDGNPSTYDPLNTGTESPQSAANYNYRSHRDDCFTFFGRGAFSRQTGADVPASGNSPFVSNMGGVEDMTWYGHLNLPDNNGSFSTNSGVTPGAGTATPGTNSYYGTSNPNNYFATSWILGRQQIILLPTTNLDNNNSALGTAKVVDLTYPNGVEQYAYMPKAGQSLSPLAYNSVAYASSGVVNPLPLASQPGVNASVLSSRIDLAATSILGFRSTLSTYITANTTGGVPPPWWTLLPTGTNNLRFQAQPFFLPPSGSTSKVTPEALAYQTPIFVRGCTQFTVEYAGDYLNQNSTAMTSGGQTILQNQGITDTYMHLDGTTGVTDGQIDFVYVSEPATATSVQNLVRKIRWYGLPRGTTNNATINATNGDVTPLRDVLAIAATSKVLVASAAASTVNPADTPNTISQAQFEKVVPVTKSDYAPIGALVSPTANTNPQYICAWGPSDPKPKMIRITITIDDPGGRLGDGQTYEYIYTLP